MDWLVICLVAFGGSLLTLFSGFGLGTILLPAFALFFPVPMAIALTAIVHLLNNVFKLVLLGKHMHGQTVLRFGLPSVVAAIAGALLLAQLTGLQPWGEWNTGGHHFVFMPVKVVVGVLLAFFALFEIIPALSSLQFPPRYLPLGGLLSGFFGGLSGHQGALRSAFLVRSGLEKEQFIATGVVIACMTDVTRLSVYFSHISLSFSRADPRITIAATLSAFAGAFLGTRLMKKVTLGFVQKTVAAMLLVFSLLLAFGVI